MYHEPTKDSIDHLSDSNVDKKWVGTGYWVCTEIKQNEKLEKKWYRYFVRQHLVLYGTKLHSISVPYFIMKTKINIQGYPKTI